MGFRKKTEMQLIISYMLIVLVTFVSVSSGVVIQADCNSGAKTTRGRTVFVEYATTSWCHYCPIAAGQLHELYSSGNYDFVYVSLVADKNEEALERCLELGLTGYPTVFFDGGYRGILGAQENTTAYINAIEECRLRKDVHNVTLDLHVRWLGEEQLSISLTIALQDNQVYRGRLRVYVTEITSRWSDSIGEPYHFSMLGYMINEDVSLSSSGSQCSTILWDGTEEGYDIEPENIMVVAALYDSNTSYVDFVTSATASSDYPDTVITEGPSGVINETCATFTWVGVDKNTSTEDLEYSYKLEPYDGFWSNWSHTTSVTYCNLSIGEYIFWVKTRNPQGEEDPFPASRAFAVYQGTPPTVRITKPGEFLYVNNKKTFIPLPVVVGDVDIEAEAMDESGVEKVEFYVDNDLKHQDCLPPYIYSTWQGFSFLKKHTIKVVAYDKVGNTATDMVKVWRIL